MSIASSKASKTAISITKIMAFLSRASLANFYLLMSNKYLVISKASAVP